MRALVSFIASALLLASILILMSRMTAPYPTELTANTINASPHALGDLIFKDYLFVFEAISLALLSAMIGAIFLVKRER